MIRATLIVEFDQGTLYLRPYVKEVSKRIPSLRSAVEGEDPNRWVIDFELENWGSRQLAEFSDCILAESYFNMLEKDISTASRAAERIIQQQIKPVQRTPKKEG